MQEVYTDDPLAPSDIYNPESEVTYDSYDTLKEDFGVAGCTLREVAHDYNFPLDYLVSSVVELGLSPPVDCDKKLSVLLNGEQCFAIVEALTTVDPAEARDRFVDQTVTEVAEDFGVDLSRIFTLCSELGANLPHVSL